MLTGRGTGWFALTGAIALLGTLFGQPASAIAALAVALWMASAWAFFLIQVHSAARRWRIDRHVDGQPAGRRMIWAGQPARIDVELHARGLALPSRIAVADRPPSFGVVEGTSRFAGVWSGRQPIRWSYQLRCDSAGVVRFDGVRIDIRDPQGLFRWTTFVRSACMVTVLPPLVDDRNAVRAVKRYHQSPAIGAHRHRRPGFGVDLLGFRAYQPGDPLKSVAWKILARREVLMTKELESETPISCRLFLDASRSLEASGGERAGRAQLVHLAAALSQRLLAARDPVALSVFDATTASAAQPALGHRQMIRVFATLAHVAAQPLEPSPSSVDAVLGPTAKLLQEVYPERLADAVNRPRRWGDNRPWFLHPWALYVWLMGTAVLLGKYANAIAAGIRRLPSGSGTVAILVLLGLLLFLLIGRRRWGWLRGDKVDASARKKVAAALAVHFGLGPAGLSWLTVADQAFSECCQRLLLAHHVPYARGGDPASLAEPAKLDNLRRLLLQAVAHGQDDELYVILADLWGLSEHWEPLFDAIKVVMARRHQVVLVCPWPGWPAPAPTEDSTPPDAAARARALALKAERERYESAHAKLRERLQRLRVPLALASTDDSVRKILERVERLRVARSWP